MSTDFQTFLATRELPDYLKNSYEFTSTKRVYKVFPKLGVPNCESDLNVPIDNKMIVTEAARELLHAMFKQIEYVAGCAGIANSDDGKIVASVSSAVIPYHKGLFPPYKLIDDFVNFVNGKANLAMSTDIVANGSVVFRKGESMFKVYNKLVEMVSKMDRRAVAEIPKLDSLEAFKRFSASNVPSEKLKIVFSSDGMDGLWDIATMSMRGIKSCQTWNDGGMYRYAVIGSVLDPNVGIVYIASDTKTKYGLNMIRRSLVRFVVRHSDKKPTLIVDTVYPKGSNDAFAELFISFLRKKTNNKIDVFFAPSMDSTQKSSYFVPSHQVFMKLSRSTRSYMDTKLNFKFDQSRRANHKVDVEGMLDLLYRSIYNKSYSIYPLYSSRFSTEENAKLRELTNKGILGDMIQATIPFPLFNAMKKIIHRKFDMESCATPIECYKAFCAGYFHCKDEIMNELHSMRAVMNRYSLNTYKVEESFTENMFKVYMSCFMTDVDSIFRSELKKTMKLATINYRCR